MATFLQPFPGGPPSFDVVDALSTAIVRPRRTVVLDAFAAAQYRPSKGRTALNPPFLRCVRNSAEKQLNAPLIGGKLYDAPNVVQGLGAQFLTKCETEGLPVVWVGTALGYEPHPSCLGQFEAIAQWLDNVLPEDFAQLPQTLKTANAGKDADEMGNVYRKMLATHARAQLRKSHMFL